MEGYGSAFEGSKLSLLLYVIQATPLQQWPQAFPTLQSPTVMYILFLEPKGGHCTSQVGVAGRAAAKDIQGRRG
jgi:hypothetical protein